jgi:aconitate hydratase
VSKIDSFKCRKTLNVGGKDYTYYSLIEAEKNGLEGISKLPYSMKVLLENLLRNEDGNSVKKADIQAVANWLNDKGATGYEIAYRPARVLMQDFTGVPAVVDLAAMRDAMVSLGGDPEEDQSARARRSGHRPLGYRRRVRHADGLRPQCREGI